MKNKILPSGWLPESKIPRKYFQFKKEGSAAKSIVPFKYYYNHAFPRNITYRRNDVCVPYSFLQAIADAPNLLKPVPIISIDALMEECQRNDPWANTVHGGTTIFACIKSLLKLFPDLIQDYWFIGNAEDMMKCILTTGTVIFGGNWTFGMIDPKRSDGRIYATGDIAGGHCTVINGANSNTDLMRGSNSFTLPWGFGGGGDFYIHKNDVQKLFDSGAKCCSIIFNKNFKLN